ncbi:hypothetical protein JW752_00375 [Candidatus Peregrinibacteria bacterium]|nr:hypothetical protein [Candidatus Peregrinibacteria bacterium]
MPMTSELVKTQVMHRSALGWTEPPPLIAMTSSLASGLKNQFFEPLMARKHGIAV